MTDTPFHFLLEYSSLKVFLFGLLGASSFIGTGRFFFDRLFGKQMPSHYALPGSMLLGLLSYSLLLQAAGFAHAASHSVLKMLLFAQLGLGNALLLLSLRPSAERSDMPTEWRRSLLSSMTAMLLAFLLGLSLFVNLIIALAPSTKADEVYVYMHAPLRMLQDGGIFYERIAHIHIASWIPQLHYQLIAAPFYALGLTDALNVVSWCLSLLFVFFIVRTIYEKTSSTAYSLLIALGLYVGMHSPVWYVTGGAGAFSVLSMTVLTYMTLDSRALADRFGSFRLLGMASLFSVATAASKLTYLPVACLCLAICALFVWRRDGYTKFWRFFAVASSFWALFYLPAFLWSWNVSGFLFGPMSDPANAAAVVGSMIEHRSLSGAIYEIAIALADLTPFVWAGCVFFFLVPWTGREQGAFAVGSLLFAAQIALFIWKLPLHFRYFGGLHLGLALFFWVNGGEYLRDRFAVNARKFRILAALCFLPWLFLQLLYSAQFFPVALGAEAVRSFAGRLVPFYDDFAKLDEILPEDAVIVARSHMPIYAPRRVIQQERELELLGYKGPIFTFGSPPATGDYIDFSREPVYHNDEAVHHAFRTPGRKPEMRPLTVYRLEKSAGTEVKE